MSKITITDKSGATVVSDSDGKNQSLPSGAGQAIVTTTVAKPGIPTATASVHGQLSVKEVTIIVQNPA